MATHRPQSAPQTGPGTGGAGTRSTGQPQRKAAEGRVVLTYLDECGFSPSQPITASWGKRGERKLIPYENPQGRRLNLLAALDKTGPMPGLYWVAKPNRALVAEEFVRFLLALPPVPVPRVAVMDNGPIHRNAVVKAALPQLWAKRIYPYYLSPYSPELNDIELVFRQLKHQELPERSYTSVPDLDSAVDHALTRLESRIIDNCPPEPRLAA